MEQRNKLKKSLKPSWVFAMALGSAIGWGAYVLPFDWMSRSGLAGTIIGFLVGGAMIMIIAFCYGYSIKALPVTGGGVAFALASLGRLNAFIAGWALVLSYTCIVALNASAVTLVFRAVLPGFFTKGSLYEIAGWTIYFPEVMVASVFLVVFAILNARGAELSGKFQFYTVVIMLFSVVLITIMSSVYYFATRPPLAPVFPKDTKPLMAVAAIVAFAPWAFVGFDSIPQLAGEFNFSPKKALKLLIYGVTAATLVYMAMMLSTTIAVGQRHSSYEDQGWPAAAAIENVLGPTGFALMIAAVSAGVLTGLNGFYVAASRVLLTLGKTEMLPKWFSAVDPKFATPRNSIMFIATLCLISPWFGRATLLWIVDMSSVGVSIAYFYTSYCTWRIATGKLQIPGLALKTAPSRFYQLVGLVGCCLSISFLALLFTPGSPGVLGREPLFALVAWLAIGVVFYLTRRSKTSLLSQEEVFDRILSTSNN